MRMPSVPPAASAPVAQFAGIAERAVPAGRPGPWWPRLETVASDEPQIAPKAGAGADGGHGTPPLAHPGSGRLEQRLRTLPPSVANWAHPRETQAE